jgi:DNA-directed RNA polymerase specialized sigma24 family protein
MNKTEQLFSNMKKRTLAHHAGVLPYQFRMAAASALRQLGRPYPEIAAVLNTEVQTARTYFCQAKRECQDLTEKLKRRAVL